MVDVVVQVQRQAANGDVWARLGDRRQVSVKRRRSCEPAG